MADEIRTRQAYMAQFSASVPASEIVKEALGRALEIRKFEIQLYWKRATYFWTLIAAAFAGYFALLSVEPTKKDPSSIFLVTCIGFLLSLGWYLVNRGSKYWQANWERHVDVLEDQVIGPLYRTTLSKEEFSIWKPSDGFPFSVSRVNQVISLFVTVIWLGLTFDSFPYTGSLAQYISVEFKYVVLASVTLVFGILVVWLGWPRSKDQGRRINFWQDEVADTAGSENKSDQKRGTMPNAQPIPRISTPEPVYSELYNEMRRFRDYELTASNWYAAMLLAITGYILHSRFGVPVNASSISHAFLEHWAGKTTTLTVIGLIATASVYSIWYVRKRYKKIRDYVTQNLEPTWKLEEHIKDNICPQPHHFVIAMHIVLAALATLSVLLPS